MLRHVAGGEAVTVGQSRSKLFLEPRFCLQFAV